MLIGQVIRNKLLPAHLLLICGISFLLVCILSGCEKKYQLPEVLTAEITSSSASVLIAGGKVVTDGGSTVVDRGICWNETGLPTIKNTKISAGAGKGEFSAIIEGLMVNRLYYFRAYATNADGTSYGNQVEYFLPATPPYIEITGTNSITYNSATFTGFLTYDNSIILYAVGICYSKTPEPTLEDPQIQGTIEGLNYTVILSPLSGNTQYFIVPYIIFRVYGTGNYYVLYGEEESFTTLPSPPQVKTDTVYLVSATSAVASGTVISNGGSPVLSRGICLDTSDNPTVESVVYTAEGDEGIFSVDIEGLEPGTFYYVRAFATNSAGTEYGWPIKFGTTHSPIADNSGNIYSVVLIGDQYWMAANLETTKYNDDTGIPVAITPDEWIAGYPACCWYNNDPASPYGLLYNWHAVNTRKLCPVGWHVPTKDDWERLIRALGGPYEAGKHLKEAGNAHWIKYNFTADNSSGFTGLPGGWRTPNAIFATAGARAFLWSTSSTWFGTNINSPLAWELFDDSSEFTTFNALDKKSGYSVRCTKD